MEPLFVVPGVISAGGLAADCSKGNLSVGGVVKAGNLEFFCDGAEELPMNCKDVREGFLGAVSRVDRGGDDGTSLDLEKVSDSLPEHDTFLSLTAVIGLLKFPSLAAVSGVAKPTLGLIESSVDLVPVTLVDLPKCSRVEIPGLFWAGRGLVPTGRLTGV